MFYGRQLGPLVAIRLVPVVGAVQDSALTVVG